MPLLIFSGRIYTQLPVKGRTYTIREVFLGREKIVNGGDSATVGLLLEELHNPPDPFHAGRQELGFSSERFAPLEELPAENADSQRPHPRAWRRSGDLCSQLINKGRVARWALVLC